MSSFWVGYAFLNVLVSRGYMFRGYFVFFGERLVWFGKLVFRRVRVVLGERKGCWVFRCIVLCERE